MLASSFKTVLLLINTKGIQAEEVEKDKVDPTKRTLQIDYAVAYQCMCQGEMSGALWSWESINLLTYALTHTEPTTTIVICTDYKSKDRFSKMMKLKKRSSDLTVQLQSSRTNICATWLINFLPSITRGFCGSFQQFLMAKELLMGLAVMSNQLFRVNQWAKERARSLCRVQSLSIKLPAKQWMLPRFFQLIKPRLRHTGTQTPFNGCQTVSMYIISGGDDSVKLW